MEHYIIVKIYFKENAKFNYHILRNTLINLGKKLPGDVELVDYAFIRPKEVSQKRGAKPAVGVVAVYKMNEGDEKTVDKMKDLLEKKKKFKWFKDYSILAGIPLTA